MCYTKTHTYTNKHNYININDYSFNHMKNFNQLKTCPINKESNARKPSVIKCNALVEEKTNVYCL